MPMAQIPVTENSELAGRSNEDSYTHCRSALPMAVICRNRVCIPHLPCSDVSKADSHVGNYGKYADYGKYKSGSKRDGIVKDREAEAAPAPVPENE